VPTSPARKTAGPTRVAPGEFSYAPSPESVAPGNFPPGFPTPFWHAPGAMLYLGDACACLRRLPSRSVHCVVTSPPYFGLRSYAEAERFAGETEASSWATERAARCNRKQNCDSTIRFVSHVRRVERKVGGVVVEAYWIGMVDAESRWSNGSWCSLGAEDTPDCLGWATGTLCGKCYVCHMVEVFAEVKRVLRDDGTLWLNLGDTYGQPSRWGGRLETPCKQQSNVGTHSQHIKPNPNTGLPSNNLIGIPWRIALALQADGWILRQDTIWYSPNKMPESVQNRCTKSHEHIFILTKTQDYYFDNVAIQEPAKSTWKDTHFLPTSNKELTATTPTAATTASWNNRNGIVRGKRRCGGSNFGKTGLPDGSAAAGAQLRPYDGGDPYLVNKRDVWIVPTVGYSGAHFAVYSSRLITPCILASTSEHGCCAECGRQHERVVVKTGAIKTEGESEFERDRSYRWSRNGVDSTLDSGIAQQGTVGWRKVCGCQIDIVAPCTVLDPFVGSGTTVATALELGRAGAGIDLSEKYLTDLAVPRIEDVLNGKVTKKSRTALMPPDMPPPVVKLRKISR